MKKILSAIFIISYLTACGSGSSSEDNTAVNETSTQTPSPAKISGELAKSINEDTQRLYQEYYQLKIIIQMNKVLRYKKTVHLDSVYSIYKKVAFGLTNLKT